MSVETPQSNRASSRDELSERSSDIAARHSVGQAIERCPLRVGDQQLRHIMLGYYWKSDRSVDDTGRGDYDEKITRAVA